jgi:hypothetical protein
MAMGASRLGGGHLAKLGCLERLDIGQSVDDPATDTEVRRALPEPSPSLECSSTQTPAAGEVLLTEVPDRAGRICLCGLLVFLVHTNSP